MFQLIPKHAFEFHRRKGNPWMGWMEMEGPAFKGWARVHYLYLYIGRVITPIRKML